jgi:hypothetical protein
MSSHLANGAAFHERVVLMLRGVGENGDPNARSSPGQVG